MKKYISAILKLLGILICSILILYTLLTITGIIDTKLYPQRSNILYGGVANN
jgi:hypothetical protein